MILQQLVRHAPFARFSNGGNSGFAALQLAIVLGFRTVGLLGFDGRPGNGPLRWHNEYGAVAGSGGCLDEWCDKLGSVEPLAALMGVRILNLSAESTLRAFPKIDAAGWRLAVEEARSGGPRPSPLEVLRDRFGGRVELPFAAARLENTLHEAASCFGGARNVANPQRYRPLPAGIEDLVLSSGASGCVLEASKVPPHAEVRRSEELGLRAELLSLRLIKHAPEAVETWLRAALQRALPDRQAVELEDWLRAGMDEVVELHPVVLRTEAVDALKAASGLARLRRGAQFVTWAMSGANHLRTSGIRELFGQLADDWIIVEHSVIGSWVSVALRPTEV